LSFNYLPLAAGLTFIIGLTAAAYSSADSALTSLTTSFYIDILGKKEDGEDTRSRKMVHLGFSIVLVIVILIFDALNNDSVINELFKLAGYTYGPLLGMFAFGLTTKLGVKDRAVPIIAILAPVFTYIISTNSQDWFGYTFGFELLILNGILTFLGLVIINKKINNSSQIIDAEI
jgi:Na+/proline symporter